MTIRCGDEEVYHWKDIPNYTGYADGCSHPVEFISICSMLVININNKHIYQPLFNKK